MPSLARPDGVDLHWEEHGSGPTLMLAPWWSGHPGVYDDLLSELARDHRVVTWDARGTGGSTRSGPYDMRTDCGDLEAMLEHVGGDVSLLCVADATNKACRVAANRPELVNAVMVFGAGPFALTHFRGEEGMLGSDAVVNAFLEMLERDYRGALRTVLSATNSQMSEDELRERVAAQISHWPQDAAAGRVRAWAEDDPTEAARELGERLWIFSAPDAAGAWLPPAEERRRLIEVHMPDAHLEETEPGTGPVSNPDLIAGRMREIIAEVAHSA
jgi:pimeloyl-ACP methyl ester carboxylesterase